MYYRKSEFAKLGVTPPKTWDEFITLSKTIKSKGVTPISIGLSDNPWLASAWFDYLDVRINGGKFHLDLLAGKHQFDDPKVKLVFEKLKEVLPYFSKSALGVSYNQSMSDLAQGKAAMYLCGAFISGAVPKDVKGDLGFFQFPIIDPSVPVVEEAPADGFIASAGTTRPNLTKRFLAFAASTEGQEILMKAQGDAALAANPDVHITLGPLAQQGKEMLESAAQVTQFFNRDAGDALQPTADAALTQFFSQPQNVDAILATWQKAAAKARAGS
jgi:multiple sugar transport system substrate-binding protein